MLRSRLASIVAALVVSAAPAAAAQTAQNAAPPVRQDARSNVRHARPDRHLALKRHVAPDGRRNRLARRRHAAHASRSARSARRARLHSRRHAFQRYASRRNALRRDARQANRSKAALHHQKRIRHARRRNVRYFWGAAPLAAGARACGPSGPQSSCN